MNNEILVTVENVSKKFCRTLKRSLWYGVQDIFQELFGIDRNGGVLKAGEFWAVENVSFELRRGECIGLIGKNGAGKSTLLKMLNGLIKPDTGTIKLKGDVGALIELGAGFNPVLTGRENIYINGAVLGLSKKKIDEKLDSIISFSGIEEFIDSPVQNYSSGMKVRLGFSIAIHTEPDILIVDEVLAVGDMGFVIKCINKIYSMLNNTAIIFVSHNMPLIYRVCNKILLMDSGKVIYQSTNVSEGIDHYYSRFQLPDKEFKNNGDACLDEMLINGIDVTKSAEAIKVNRLEALVIELKFRVNILFKLPEVRVIFFDREFNAVATYMHDEQEDSIINKNGVVKVRIKLEKIFFSKGIFSLTVTLTDHETYKVLLRQKEAAYIQILSEQEVWTPMQLIGEIQQLN